jgi:hypothetical protein
MGRGPFIFIYNRLGSWGDFPIAMDSAFLIYQCDFRLGIPGNPVGKDLVPDVVIGT